MEKLSFLPLTWEEVYDLSIRLVEKIRKSKFDPDVIVGIARGGWMVARIISDFLDNDNVANVRVQFYSNIGETMQEPIISQRVSVDVKDKKVLLCDDVSDTGNSFKASYDHLIESGAHIVKTAALHQKPHTIFKPDFWIDETDKWIIYPWERRETVNKLIRSFVEKEKNLSEELLLEKLKVTGIDESLLNLFIRWSKEDGIF